MKLLVVAPPFYSHFRPMLAIAKAAAGLGAEVLIACSEEFRAEIEGAGLGFRQLQINKNKNVPGMSSIGSGGRTREEERLQEFIEAGFRGPVETLMTQGAHRLEDMLANPEALFRDLGMLWEELKPDLALVDQLSYGVSLALHLHRLPFVSFCPPHPASIPEPGRLYSVPPVWPSCFEVSDADQARLERRAAEVEEAFAERFRAVAHACGRPERAPAYPFGLLASHGVIYTYPDLGSSEGTGETRRFFAGYSFEPAPVPAEFAGTAAEASTVLIALGTFLSRRHDVLAGCAHAVAEHAPDLRILVGAGTHDPAAVTQLAEQLRGIAEVYPFLPQEPLLSECDFVLHHGGVGSFTESLYHGVPMIVLPFSSDQFNVAYDVERHGLGTALDPNKFSRHDIRMALETCMGRETRERSRRWSGVVRESGGPQAAAARLLEWAAQGR